MAYATVTGILKDSDGTAWKQATWTAVPVSPSSKPVFPDGTPVPTTSGLLDDLGNFSGQVPQTLSILPPGTTLTFTITSMTSAPPLTITKVQIVAAAVDLGALLSPRITAPRIKAAAIVYAYNAGELTNPVHGNGYVNTYENLSYIYMQNSWVKIGASPNFDAITANTADLGTLTVEGTTQLNGNVTAAGGAVKLQAIGVSCANTLALGTEGWYSDDIPQVVGDSNGNLVMSPSSAGATFLNWTKGGGVKFGNGASAIVASIDDAGSPTFNGLANFQAGTSGIRITGQTPTVGILPRELILAMYPPTNTCYIDCSGVDAATVGNGIHFRLISGDGSVAHEIMQILDTGINVNGNINKSGTNSFRIPHPLDQEKWLVHGCIEGPESGVYYRGEAALVDGRATVELPEYFEALTLTEERTVLLTQVDEGGELAILAASRVVNGRFSIRSNVSSAVVSWEVKAVRRDTPRLEVVQARTSERSKNES